jgi:hypothetical protein
MRLICPSCGAIHSAEAWLSDADARQSLIIVAELPWEVSRRCFNYLALFRPTTGRGLIWAKTLRLLSELQALVKADAIKWDRGAPKPNGARYWAMAMEKIIELPPKKLPLKSHGYLNAIAYDEALGVDQPKPHNPLPITHNLSPMTHNPSPVSLRPPRPRAMDPESIARRKAEAQSLREIIANNKMLMDAARAQKKPGTKEIP